MKYLKLFRNGIKNLLVNKLRTGLAMLGVMIGIASVIGLVSIGELSQQTVQYQIQTIGSNLLIVTPGTLMNGIVNTSNEVTTLTLNDAEAIQAASTAMAIGYVSPEYTTRAQAISGRNNANTQIIGVTPAYAVVHNIELSYGDFITDADYTNHTNVAVVGPTVAKDLFGQNTIPLNQKIRVNGQILNVIGMTTSKGTNGIENQDDVILIPLSTAQKRVFNVNYLSTITLEVNDENTIGSIQDQVTQLLLKKHNITKNEKADFIVQSKQDILDAATNVESVFSSLLSSVAIISLIVGGVGIMNIMLMVVMERTREIGLRKALGATENVIVSQFLVEAVVLTVAGGVFGMIMGVVGLALYAYIFNAFFYVSINSIIIAFAASVGVGVLFGWYPAHRAAEMQPIDALRYE